MATPRPSAKPSVPARPPDPGQPLPRDTAGSETYRGQAGRYDRRTDAFRRWRELAVHRLPAQPGETVLDVGCGTGLCLPLLQHKVGPSGTIIGIDASPQMLEVAGARVAEHGWDNVQLFAAPVAQGRSLEPLGQDLQTCAAGPGRSAQCRVSERTPRRL